MKRIFSLTLLTIAIIGFIAIANAQDNKTAANPKTRGMMFVDKNGDGICDNFDGTGLGNNRQGFHGKSQNNQGRGTGICNGKGNPNCTNFIDANKDGICDKYVDANKDGVCDNHKNCKNTPPRDGSGKKHRGHRK